MRYECDGRGDPVRDVLEAASEQVLVQRHFDGLGRLDETTNFNPEAAAALGSQRVVKTLLAYDSLGRLEQESQQVGTGALRVLGSEWGLDGAGRWQREVRLPGGRTTRLERYDGAARRVRDERTGPGGASDVTGYEWLGELPVARSQTKGTSSPFRESRDYDSFGATRRWDYSAVDLAGGQPVNAAEGASYCGGTWDAAACGEPLYGAEVVRDVMGRVGSLQWKWSNPTATSAPARVKPWRGYGYSAQGRLAVELEDEGFGTSIATASLVAPVTEQQLRLVAAGRPAWAWERETVGGTQAVREEATGAVRWRTTVPREDYQLRGVEVGGVSRQVEHDAEGRVVEDGARRYRFGARGELLEVLEGGASLEAYTYDGLGRLVGVYGGATARTVLTYDGAQAVQSTDGSGAVQWEASWGPGQDELLEWEDVAGGTGRHLAVRDSRGGVVGYWSVAAAALSETVTYTAQGQVVRRNLNGGVACSEETGGTCALPEGSPFGFSAAWRSEVTGLVAMRARWYSPALGEFLSQDPAGYVDSFNLYAYAGYDPINGWDPAGMQAFQLDAGSTKRLIHLGQEKDKRHIDGGDQLRVPSPEQADRLTAGVAGAAALLRARLDQLNAEVKSWSDLGENLEDFTKDDISNYANNGIYWDYTGQKDENASADALGIQPNYTDEYLAKEGRSAPPNFGISLRGIDDQVPFLDKGTPKQKAAHRAHVLKKTIIHEWLHEKYGPGRPGHGDPRKHELIDRLADAAAGGPPGMPRTGPLPERSRASRTPSRPSNTSPSACAKSMGCAR